MGAVTLPPSGRSMSMQIRSSMPLNELRGLGLKTPDALHAATAIVCQCDVFVTNDPVFQRVPNLPLALLTEVLRN